MKTFALFLRLAAGLAPLAARGELYSIDWFTLDGGGGTSAGGGFVLQGTVGQPEAQAPAQGGGFTLVGGFWGGYPFDSITGAPMLNIAALPDGTVRITWSPAPSGFVLQQSPGLAPASWADAPSGAANPITLPADASARFYRLRKP